MFGHNLKFLFLLKRFVWQNKLRAQFMSILFDFVCFAIGHWHALHNLMCNKNEWHVTALRSATLAEKSIYEFKKKKKKKTKRMVRE